jgi:hypothetical protein
LHLSAANGLTDLAGNPLVGNDPSGDYVIHFSVNGPARGSGTDPLTWNVQGQQDLGVLFPNELRRGVHLVRGPLGNGGSPPPGGVDSYQFQVLQSKLYNLVLTSRVLPRGLKLKILDSTGQPVHASSFRLGGVMLTRVDLPAGSYTIQLQGWAPGAGYTLTLALD